MSTDILGNKQKIIIPNCLINDENHTTQTNNRQHKNKKTNTKKENY